MRWKPALNAFAITFADRRKAAETYSPKMLETPKTSQTLAKYRSHPDATVSASGVAKQLS